MRGFFLIACCFSFITVFSQIDTRARVKKITSLIKSNPDSAGHFANELIIDSKDSDDGFGIVQGYYIKAYIYHAIKGELGKALIQYLEAIRYAEGSTYPERDDNLISLYKNSGSILNTFESYELAITYYTKALNLAEEIDSENQLISLRYNLSNVYEDLGDINISNKFLRSILKIKDIDASRRLNTLVNLSWNFYELNRLDSSKLYADSVIKISGENFPKYKTFSYHLLGKIAFLKNDLTKSNDYLTTGLGLSRVLDNTSSNRIVQFEIFTDLGRSALKSNDFLKAEEYYSSAENIMPYFSPTPEHLELHKKQSDLYFETNQFELSKQYEDLYAKKVKIYLEEQKAILESDKANNIQMVTNLYFGELENQQEVSSMKMYAQIMGVAFIVVLLLTVVYFQHNKRVMKRNLAEELVKLKNLDSF